MQTHQLRVQAQNMRKTSIHTIHTLGIIGEAREDDNEDEDQDPSASAPVLRRPRSNSNPDHHAFGGLTLRERMAASKGRLAQAAGPSEPVPVFGYSDDDLRLSLPDQNIYPGEGLTLRERMAASKGRLAQAAGPSEPVPVFGYSDDDLRLSLPDQNIYPGEGLTLRERMATSKGRLAQAAGPPEPVPVFGYSDDDLRLSLPDQNIYPGEGLTLRERMAASKGRLAQAAGPSEPVPVFGYSDDDLRLSLPDQNIYPGMAFPLRNNRSLDTEVLSRWEAAAKSGAVNYSLNLMYKHLPGRFGLSCQLNIERATLRRKPHPHRSLHDSFDHRRFNFTKIKQNEFLLELADSELAEEAEEEERDYLVVNASPVEKGHALLLPAVRRCSAQRLTERGLRLATKTGLLSAQPRLVLAFNSLLAHASVNHAHFHFSHWPYESSIGAVPVRRLGPHTFVCDDDQRWYMPFLAFQVASLDEQEAFVRAQLLCADLLSAHHIAHNLVMLRSPPLKDPDGKVHRAELEGSSELYLTAYLFPRQSVFGAKPTVANFHPAAFELAGMLLIYSFPFFASMSEEQIVRSIGEEARLSPQEYANVFAKAKEKLQEAFPEPQ